MRKGLEKERQARAEKLFKEMVRQGRIQFRLRLDGRNWKMPLTIETMEPENAPQLTGKDGGPLEKSLFSPVYRNELNGDERDVAVYLDSETTLKWWHRNVARKQYGLQGWRRGKIYPDFIFAVNGDGRPERIIVLETKGDQLEGNLDTEYKRKLLQTLSENFAWDDTIPAGELKLENNGETVECALILMSEWKARLPEYLESTKSG